MPRRSFAVTNGSVEIQPVPIPVANAHALDFLFFLFKPQPAVFSVAGELHWYVWISILKLDYTAVLTPGRG